MVSRALLLVIALGGCVDVRGPSGAFESSLGDVSGAPATDTSDGHDGPDAGTSGATDGTSGDTSTKFDFEGGSEQTTGPVDLCKVNGDIDGVGDCSVEAPPDSFEPDVQWTFGADLQSWVTPLVGNFTDDNADGSIDLCDVPDVLLVATTFLMYGKTCDLYVLDGATGSEHFAIPASEKISCMATPAFGDIDNDGLPEIVALWNDAGIYRLKAFEHDGTPKWTNTTDGDNAAQGWRESGAVAIHDLDADGDPEILFNHEAYRSDGTLLFEKSNPWPGELEATVGVDLDGDGQMEMVTGHSAYRADGSVYYDAYPTITAQAIPQIGNLDDDPQPEVFITAGDGLWMLEHDGAIKWGPKTPTGADPDPYLVWQRPGTIHDFDGDGNADWASSLRNKLYAVFQGPADTDVLWQADIADYSGAAGGTAFDFLGDGVAEAMYADEDNFFIFDGLTGAVLLSQARGSATISEYPVVADIDDDGSAEILVVSSSGQPALQAIRDVQDRWIQARRIWNQQAYYVTNVREDSTIPAQPVPNWPTLNTYRTNAQIEDGGLCDPEPEG